MRISDWSSDVCSSDRNEGSKIMQKKGGRTQDHAADMAAGWRIRPAPPEQRDRRCSGAKPMERSPPMLYLRICFDKPDMLARRDEYRQDRKSVGSGKSSVSVDLGGRRIHKKKKK